MKLYIIFFLAFASMFINPLMSQSNGWELADGTGGYFTSLYESENGDFIAVMYPKDNLTKIVKLDKDGNQINETYLFTDSIPLIIDKIVYIKSTDSYLLIGNSFLKNENAETFKRYFVVVNIDTNLNVENIDVTKFDLSGSIESMNHFLTEDDKILLSIYIYAEGLLQDKEHLFIKLNKYGKIENFYIDKGHHECYSIIKSGDGFQCLGMQIRNFDQDFNLKNVENKLNSFIKSPSRAIRINENKILIGLLGTYLPNLFDGGAVVYYLQNDLSIINKNWIKTELGPTTVNKVCDISPDSSIFISTIELYDENFTVGKFDLDLNLIWQIKFENKEEFRYRLWGMEATNDNGIILYGMRRNWKGTNDKAYIIIFDSKGQLVYTNNISKSEFTTIKTFPNPSSGPLILDIKGITGKADVCIYDMLGRKYMFRMASQKERRPWIYLVWLRVIIFIKYIKVARR